MAGHSKWANIQHRKGAQDAKRPAAALSDPHDDRALQVIDQRRVLVALAVGDLVDADDPKSPHTMATTIAFNAAVQLVGQSRGGHLQQLRRRLLGHHLAQAQHGVLEAIADPRVTRGPGDLLLGSTVGAAHDLARGVAQCDLSTRHRQVSPLAGSRTTAHPPTASAALRASRPVLEWFHLQHQCTVAAEPHTGNLQNTVELQQLCDSLGSGHGSPRRRFGLVW